MEQLYGLCENGIFDELARNSYIIVASSILKDYLERENHEKNKHCFEKPKPCHLIEAVQEFEEEMGKKLKMSYCAIMESLKERKSEIISKNVIANICESIMNMREYVEESLKNGTDEIGKVSCMIINHKITGIPISKTVYRTLKLKFYRKYSPKLWIHDENSSEVSYKKSKVKNLLDMSCAFKNYAGIEGENIRQSIISSRNKNKKQTKIFVKIDEESEDEGDNESYIGTKEEKELINEIKLVFTEKNTNRLDKSERKVHDSKTNKHSRKRLSENHSLTSDLEERTIKLLGFATYRNSEAFKEKRQKLNNGEKHGYPSFDIKNNKKPKIMYPKSKIETKTEVEIKNINANLKFLFEKKDKKPLNKEVHKRSVLEWEKKVSDLQHFKNVERAELNIPGSKWHQRRNSEEEYEKRINIQSFYKNKISHKIVGEVNSECGTLSGFCEFIDISEPSQHGIVKSIINFENHRPEYEFKKISPKGLKEDLQEFHKKAQKVYESCFDETEFELRLQKVLSSKIK